MTVGRPSATRVPLATGADFDALSKPALHALADRLLVDDLDAVERCVAFVVAETQGFWHGRARATMCRRLKHCALSAAQRAALVACVTGRLAAGTFSEQFKDQLRLAMHLDLPTTRRASAACLESRVGHVRRYAAWVLSPEHLRKPPSMP